MKDEHKRLNKIELHQQQNNKISAEERDKQLEWFP
jgi:hypothetical protein